MTDGGFQNGRPGGWSADPGGFLQDFFEPFLGDISADMLHSGKKSGFGEVGRRRGHPILHLGIRDGDRIAFPRLGQLLLKFEL